MQTRSLLRRWLPVVLFFALLSGIALAPLSLRMSAGVPGAPPGEGGRVLDYYHFHWNLWWLRYALLEGRDIWTTDMVLAPYTHNLTYHSLTASMLPFYVVLEPLLGHLRAANSIIWISLALTGALMYAFLRWNSTSRRTALLAGIALAMSPYMLDHAGSGHLNLLTVWWLPLVLFAWEKTDRTQRVGWAVLAGLVLWGMWFTDTLIVLWGGLLLGPYALYALFKAPHRAARLRLIALGVLALVITVTLAYALGPLRQTLAFDMGELPPARLLTLRYYSLDLSDIVFPSPGSVQKYGTESDETLGLLLVVLTVIALVVRQPCAGRAARHYRWFWLWAALPALILALGPDETLFGVRVPLPFRIIHELFGGQMRTPIRFLPPATVALLVFLARTFDPWLRRLRPPALGTAISAVVVFGLVWDYGVLKPFPTIPALEPYAFHTMMRGEDYGDDYDYVVLDVPSGPFTGWRDVGTHPEAMVYGITHQKRQVSGLLSRIPIAWHVFYETDPLLGWLTSSRELDASRAAVKLNHYIDEWPIGYVVVHMDWMEPERLQEALAFFNAQPSLCLVTVERDAVLYRTTSHPKGCPPRLLPQDGPGVYALRLGEPGADATLSDAGYVGQGWYPPESIGGEPARWTGGQREALLYVALPPDGIAYTLTLRAVAFAEPRTVQAVAGRVVDGALVTAQLGAVTVAPGDWRAHTLTISAAFVQATGGEFTISLAVDGALSPAEMGLSEDTRPLAVAYDWITFARAGE